MSISTIDVQNTLDLALGAELKRLRGSMTEIKTALEDGRRGDALAIARAEVRKASTAQVSAVHNGRGVV